MLGNRSIYPKWLLSYLESKSVEVSTLAESSDLCESQFSGVQSSLPLDGYLKLFEWSADHFNEPHLGLKLAGSAEEDDYGLFGFLTTSAGTIGELCELSERYQRILMSGETIEFIRHRDLIEARFSISTGLHDKTAQDVEFTLATVVHVIRRCYGDKSITFSAKFAHKKIEPEQDYFEVFGEDIVFDQPCNSVFFSASIWDAPIETANSNLLGVLKDQANRLLNEVEDHADFLSYVKLLIGSRLSDERFNVEVLAQEMNMSSRTLYRRLKSENTNFMDLRLSLVMDAAKYSLLNEKISVTQLAHALGYSESSAFVRVFKKQQGKSPLQYRKDHSR